MSERAGGQDPRVAAVMDRVRRTDWGSWAIPLPDRIFDYEPNDVVPAFELLVTAVSPAERQRAYHATLSAIGHHHSGTPYTAMSPAAPLLAALTLCLDGAAPAAMEIVVDCLGWSAGEPVFRGPDDADHDLAADIADAVRPLVPLALQWSSSPDPDRRGPARDLLELLSDHDGR